MGQFDDARFTFQKFRNQLSPQARSEIEHVVRSLLASYDTAIYENRFLVGGVVEHVLCAAFNSIDDFVSTRLKVARYDIRVEDRKTGKAVQYSAKSQFVRGGAINLINVRGDDPTAKWNEATIFVLPEVGIVYADPDQGLQTERVPDAVQIDVEEVRTHARRNPDFVVPVEIPYKMKADPSRQRTASEDVARLFLQGCKKLRLDKA